MLRSILPAAVLAVAALPVNAGIISVLPGQSIATAVAGASPGDDIQIQPGTYINDFPVVTVPLTIEAAPGKPLGSVTINDTAFPNDQGVIENLSNLLVDRLVIKGAHTTVGGGDNAAGIRDHGTGLTVTNTILDSNQNGILTEDPTRTEAIVITNDQFLNNGSGNGQTHALYVGDAASLIVTGSTFCGTNNGHDVKSRATTTSITGSTMYIGAAGGGCNASDAGAGVDLPNGGLAGLVNDAIIQGPSNSNGALILYGEDGALPGSGLSIVGSTLAGAGLPDVIGVREFGGCPAPVNGSNNTLSGLTTEISPTGCGSLNSSPVVTVPEPGTIGLMVAGLFWLVYLLRPRDHRHLRQA